METYLGRYIDIQCQLLYEDFQKNPQGSFSGWLAYPSQYIAPMAYEAKAIDMGLYLETHYHKLYAKTQQLSSTKEQQLEDLNNKNKPTQAGPLIPAPPSLTAPVFLLNNSPSCLPNKKFSHSPSHTPTLLPQTLSSIDQVTKVNATHEAMLTAIRRGVPLKKVKKQNPENNCAFSRELEYELLQAFAKMRPSMAGDMDK